MVRYLVLTEEGDGDFRLSSSYYKQISGLSDRCLARLQWHHFINRYLYMRALVSPAPKVLHIDRLAVSAAWPQIRQPLPLSFMFQPISSSSCCRKARAHDPLCLVDHGSSTSWRPIVHWFMTTVLPLALQHLQRLPRLQQKGVKRKRHYVVVRRTTAQRPKRSLRSR